MLWDENYVFKIMDYMLGLDIKYVFILALNYGCCIFGIFGWLYVEW